MQVRRELFQHKEVPSSSHLPNVLKGIEDIQHDESVGFELITTDDIDDHGVADIIRKIRARVGDSPVYLRYSPVGTFVSLILILSRQFRYRRDRYVLNDAFAVSVARVKCHLLQILGSPLQVRSFVLPHAIHHGSRVLICSL